MQKLLQIDFPFTGPFADDMTQALSELALSITQEPGFIWKIWTESKSDHEAGGIYVFADHQSAQAYLDKHTARLKNLGVNEVRARIYDMNLDLSKITKAPI